jgi:hypothetical protein
MRAFHEIECPQLSVLCLGKVLQEGLGSLEIRACFMRHEPSAGFYFRYALLEGH